ncbi:hypothetical protein Hanom_Chr15g01342901 [Helianthus anomalus]
MKTNMKFLLFFHMLLMNYNNNVIAMSPVAVCMSQGINIRPVRIVDYAPTLCNDNECSSECIHRVPWNLRLVSHSCQLTICICCGTDQPA